MEALRLIVHLGKDSANHAPIRAPSRWMQSTTNEAHQYLEDPDGWCTRSSEALALERNRHRGASSS
eukprot:1519392-Heterocapsa_arctica.AAC.1